ncbi:MAG: hypothetical protein LAT83_22870 [Kiritimatiellae bacterium]|nr:hypothetical protein [Kiritimatiellia bacterium]
MRQQVLELDAGKIGELKDKPFWAVPMETGYPEAVVTLVTVADGAATAAWGEPEENFDADYRRWGSGNWFQNTRLTYWPMLAAGDHEQMLPFFREHFPGRDGQGRLRMTKAQCLEMWHRTTNPGRFPAFWGPNLDWIPDLDQGSNLLMGLQTMLLQADDEDPRLFPACPELWHVRLRLHAPGKQVVEGER